MNFFKKTRKEKVRHILRLIDDNQLVSFAEVTAFLDVSATWAHKSGLAEDDDIKSALVNKKTKKKHELREKWKGSPKPALQLALYKLMATEEECHRLNGYRREDVKNEIEMRVSVKDIERISKELRNSC